MARVITERKELQETLDELRSQGRSIVFTNGAFDIIHVGHVRYLYGAAAEGDVLVVAVNTDESIKEYKSKDRPLQPLAARMEIVAAFEPVSIVTCFGEKTCDDILEQVRPNVMCKGPEYGPHNLPEYETTQRLGIRLATVGGPKDNSSTELINKLQALGL